MNAVWKSLYAGATEHFCALLTFTEHFATLN